MPIILKRVLTTLTRVLIILIRAQVGDDQPANSDPSNAHGPAILYHGPTRACALPPALPAHFWVQHIQFLPQLLRGVPVSSYAVVGLLLVISPSASFNEIKGVRLSDMHFDCSPLIAAPAAAEGASAQQIDLAAFETRFDVAVSLGKVRAPCMILPLGSRVTAL